DDHPGRTGFTGESLMILVTGATGHVGSELLTMLMRSNERVRAMTRRPEQARFPSGVEVVRADFDDAASLRAALNGVSGLFLMTAQHAGASPKPTHIIAAVEAARSAGVSRLVQLSVLAGGGRRDDVITRWVREAEASVKASGIAWTILRPGRFMSNTLEWAPMIKKDGRVMAPFGSRPAASIDPADIAAVALQALTEPGHEGKSCELSGPEALTPIQEIRIISAQLGREIQFVEVPIDAMRSGLLRVGFSTEAIEAIIERTANPDEGAEIFDTVKEVTDRSPRRFAEW